MSCFVRIVCAAATFFHVFTSCRARRTILPINCIARLVQELCKPCEVGVTQFSQTSSRACCGANCHDAFSSLLAGCHNVEASLYNRVALKGLESLRTKFRGICAVCYEIRSNVIVQAVEKQGSESKRSCFLPQQGG